MRSFCLSLFLICLFSTSLIAQQPSPHVSDLVNQVRPAVVQILVKITEPEFLTEASKKALSPEERECFGFHYCIVGSGFFVNTDGDIVTAAHVALDVQGIVTKLQDSGAKASVFVGVSQPNFENANITIASNTEVFPITRTAMDITHDLAVFHPDVNPFQNKHDYIVGAGPELQHPQSSFLRLALDRPRDAEDVFACGYPFATPGMVTTSGTIGSAWKSENVVTAKENNISTPIDVYQADLRINPGNSGGPVLRISDQAVLGVAIESRGTLDTVVPSKYVAKFLTEKKISFSTASSPSAKR